MSISPVSFTSPTSFTSTSSTSHTHIIYSIYVSFIYITYIIYIGLICVTYIIYIINTIYRCSTPTYLRQNSYSAICRGVIAQELLKRGGNTGVDFQVIYLYPYKTPSSQVSIFLSFGGRGSQVHRNVTLCGDRLCWTHKRVVKCKFLWCGVALSHEMWVEHQKVV
jgi:hypothetical protein